MSGTSKASWRRKAAAVVVAAATGLGAATAVQPVAAREAPTSQQARAAEAPSLLWRACQRGFQCARVLVPRDHDEPDGAKVGLSVIRLPAAEPERRIGALFVNPGGPGGSGVDFVRQVAEYLPLELRGRFDIVGFDPRGIMRSTAVRCYRSLEHALSDQPQSAFPLTAAQEWSWIRLNREFATACRLNGGPVMWQMSTADVARDMDLLRQAMGEEQLSFLGISYGSMIGQTYANLFPERSRAIVIDGVLDPVAWTSGGADGRKVPVGARLRSAEGARDTLREFFRLCEEAGRRCAFSGNAKERFDRLALRLQRSPLVGGGWEVTYQDLIGVTLGTLYTSYAYPDLAEALAELERATDARSWQRHLARLRTKLGLAQTKPTYFNFVEGTSAVLCADSTNPRWYGTWQRQADVVARSQGRFGRLWMWQSGPCGAWADTVGRDRYAGPWNAETANPVLVVGNRFDPATPYSGAQAAARLLPSSRLLTYAGPGHAAFFTGNHCVDSRVTSYLVTTEPPPEGTVCQPAGSPFGVLAARAGRQAAEAQAALVATTLPPAVRRALAPRG